MLLRLNIKQVNFESVSEQHEDEHRKSKRQKSSDILNKSCLFCSEVSGTLHNCAKMKLDHDLRKMASELKISHYLLAFLGRGILLQ